MLMFHLWGDVVWCAYGRLGPNHAVGSHFHAGPEVCELEVALGVQQHVVWLHVPDNKINVNSLVFGDYLLIFRKSCSIHAAFDRCMPLGVRRTPLK